MPIRCTKRGITIIERMLKVDRLKEETAGRDPYLEAVEMANGWGLMPLGYFPWSWDRG